jgi:hypothetical protein
MKCSIWRLPDDYEMSLSSDDSTSLYNLRNIAELPVEGIISAIWEPSSSDDHSDDKTSSGSITNSNNIVTITENCIYNFDCNTSTPQVPINTSNSIQK